MRIAVNARMLTQRRPGGIARYARETLQRITRRHGEHEFLFMVDRPFRDRESYPENVTVARAFPSVHPLLWYPWFELAVPRMLNRFGADLFLSPDGFNCLSTEIPTVVVIHDLSFELVPGDMPFLIHRYYRHFFPLFARKARAIATVSEYSKQDIVRLYGGPADRVSVTYNGVSDFFRPLSGEDGARVRAELTGGKPYFLAVGAIHPRKNLPRLIRSYDRFRREGGDAVKLVLTGPNLFRTGETFQALQECQYRDDILLTGILSDARLAEIFGAARAFFLVSVFEGFGIPILEAMACDVPVVAADRTALPEVCGDAALLVDPFSVEAISGAMGRIHSDQNLRDSLVERGRARRELFNWDNTADLLWKAVERAMS
jgi:glycosyltransferase involved in cell wall biosynthesis